MAFAAKSTICDKCIAVSFNKQDLPIGDHIKHVEISDTYATKLLTLGSDILFVTIPDSPAYQRESDLRVIKYLVSKVPSGGTIVELGSALGGNAHYILNAAPHIGKIACFDPDWKTECNNNFNQEWYQWILDIFGTNDVNSSYDFAKKILSPYPQAELHALSSPHECQWWSEPIDMMFEDASHDSDVLRANIEFWVQFIKPNGIIAGHDFNNKVVADTISQLSKELGLKLEYSSAVWWMIKR